MEVVDQHVWKQFQEGLRQGVVGPYVQCNVVDGDDVIRCYLHNHVEVARMRVCESNTSKPGQECVRVFEIAADIVQACKSIAVLTDADWVEFDEFDGDDDEWLSSRGVVL